MTQRAPRRRRVTRSSIEWSLRAEKHEAKGDWDHAAEAWYRAAETLVGNPHDLRATYNTREDAAKAKALEAAR